MQEPSRPDVRPAGRRPSRRIAAILAAGLVLGAAAGGAALAIGRAGSTAPKATGVLVDQPVPRLWLRDESGRRTSLEAFRGKVVVLAPFLTLCHEICPLTTGAFEAMQRALDRAGLSRDVVFAEVSVDPWRDTPARLRAFAQLTGVRFHLFTGTQAELTRFWRFFGVGAWRTKEGSPPDRDWLTHRALTFDVSHTDGLFVIDARGHERVVHVGMAQPGKLPSTLAGLLNDTGRRALAHPEPGWTIQQALDDVGYVLGRPIRADA